MSHPRRPRLEDVASAVGLSPSSVSLVLNNAPGPSERTREKVLAAAAALGYTQDRAASSLARRRSRLLGVVMDLHNTFHAELVDEIQHEAGRHGHDVVLSTVTQRHDERNAIDTLLGFRSGALILLGSDTPTRRLAALTRTLPLVVVGRRLRATDIDSVHTDDTAGMSAAVSHLTGLGHRRIAYVDGGGGPVARGRRRGYEAAMRRHGLAGQVQVVAGDHTEESGMRAVRELLAEPSLPSAVMAFNDRCALGVLEGLSRAGVGIPDQVSVVGYDDSPLSRLTHIDLTTVNQNPSDQAVHAVQAALDLLHERRPSGRHAVLSPRLVVRGTTAAPRPGTR